MTDAAPGHAEGCWGVHTDAMTCAEVTERRAWHEQYQKPWECPEYPPDGRSQPVHLVQGDNQETCARCGVRFSELPVVDPEDAPWRSRATSEQP
jgi:hypothetical protein